MNLRLLKNEQGFTLMELLIYATLTAIVVGVFSSILIVVTRVQEHQSSAIQVTAELNTMMNIIKSRIYNGTDVSVTDNILSISSPTTTLYLIYMSTSTPESPRLILQDFTTFNPHPISSQKVRIDEATFTELRSGDSTAIQIVLTVTTSSSNPNQLVTRTLRATAAPFKQAQ